MDPTSSLPFKMLSGAHDRPWGLVTEAHFLRPLSGSFWDEGDPGKAACQTDTSPELPGFCTVPSSRLFALCPDTLEGPRGWS